MMALVVSDRTQTQEHMGLFSKPRPFSSTLDWLFYRTSRNHSYRGKRKNYFFCTFRWAPCEFVPLLNMFVNIKYSLFEHPQLLLYPLKYIDISEEIPTTTLSHSEPAWEHLVTPGDLLCYSQLEGNCQ